MSQHLLRQRISAYKTTKILSYLNENMPIILTRIEFAKDRTNLLSDRPILLGFILKTVARLSEVSKYDDRATTSLARQY
ncbi:MAG: hypothetical protein CME93_05465 [Hyphomonadaceae bacterium]|nr:hypothetical protein [Hyphomonadaceae bacterium]MAV50390.1 hypothetical protein [Hyphomonadaceae bacterium]OUX94799.1 MAG: hypothetical protein CBB77_07030 [Hyphomonas sp. TMED17]OUX95597.1 MAG: hypothetical protein CBB77_00220 [Hyphomonas sp. TMED17]